MINHKVPPQSNEAEMSVLGAILIDDACVGKVRHTLGRDDFYRESHRLIYAACLDLSVRKHPIDLITLSEELKKSGNLGSIGGSSYLATLVDYVPTAANVSHYAKIVHSMALKRRMLAAAMKMIDMAHDDTCDIEQAVIDSRGAIADIAGVAHSAAAGDLMNLEQRVERYIKYVRQVGTHRFRTGFGDIDNHIRGVAPGEVLTIIAYSGTFKSALLQNLLSGNAERTGMNQIFFSMEMPAEKCVEREIQMLCGMNGRSVEDLFKGDGWKDSYTRMLKQKADKLLVCDKPKRSIDQIAAYIEIARSKYGAVGGVGIDYLGLMASEGKSIFDKTAALSADIKAMAKELQVPVILLGQVHRGYAASKNLEIEMDAAKGGGDIEAGADFMLGMWAKDDRLFAKLLKNRNGSAGDRWEIDIDRDTLKFLSATPYNGDDSPAEEPASRRRKKDDLPDF